MVGKIKLKDGNKMYEYNKVHELYTVDAHEIYGDSYDKIHLIKKGKLKRFLFNACYWILDKIGAIDNVQDCKIEYNCTRYNIKHYSFDEIEEYLYKFEKTYGIKIIEIVIGKDVEKKILGNKSNRVFSFELPFKSMLGIKLTVLPYIEGILFLPERN